ncbi:MAG TPA: alpha-mannosidase, partial [Thermotoga sp.]|nr:alpha-mannosidase [Thermotoga sp.]
MKVFVICHTHWDREWFLTSEYTNEWLSRLFENLLDLTRKKKDFIFVLDGQTLILEDLFSIRPDLRDDVFKLVEEGKFIIGPVYAQIDWRISSEYSIWKNFSIGMRDIEKYHARKFCGWFMDNFGQISQIPQILRIFGLDCVFVWRGVKMEEGKERMILEWESPDGSRVLTIFLIAGYRNLYNLSETKKIARKRFDHEVNKVQNFTDIPLLLDGYDLDIHPEDPRDFL